VDFYVKNDSGEYSKATEQQIEELFKEKSEKIVSAKLKTRREKMRAEMEEELRNELSEKVKAEIGDSIKAETRKEVETEYQKKLSESESKAKKLDIELRRKTIAAEYGFKVDAEQFLGDGTDDEMRAKADALKDSFAPSQSSNQGIEKKTSEPETTGCVTLNS
jgi:ATP-dependent protease HslVU (ClpYQ) ATPase subunit